MLRKLPLWLAALLILLAVFFLFGGLAPSYPYTYDEADYMYAGKRGFAANYLDQDAIPLPTFVQKGLELMRTPGQRSSFSEYIRSTGDINMYRHFHGPVYAYWLAFGQLRGLSDPGQYRRSGIFIHLTTTLASMLIFWWLFPSLPTWGGLLAGHLIGFSRTALVTSMGISQHLAFILVSLLTLAAAARFLRDFNPRWFYAMMTLLAVSYATVESAAFLTLGLALALFCARRDLLTSFHGWRGLLSLGLRGLAAWTIALLACWPMGILNLNFLKGYLAMGYLSLSRQLFSPISFVEMWTAKFSASPWEFGAFLAAIPLLWLCRRRLPRESWPFLCYALVFLLITIKMTITYTHYLGSFTTACAIILAIAASSIAQSRPGLTAPILFTALALTLVPTTLAYRSEAIVSQTDRPHLDQILTYFAQPTAQTSTHWFVPFEFVPMLHFYHPSLRFTAYDTDWATSRLAQAITQTNLPAGLLCDPQTCAQIQTLLGPQRFIGPTPVAQPARFLAQSLAALQFRSAQ